MLASIDVADTKVGEAATAIVELWNSGIEPQTVFARLYWATDQYMHQFTETLAPNETKILNFTVPSSPVSFLGNFTMIEFIGQLDSYSTFKCRGQATFHQSNCLQGIAGQSYIRLHNNVQINEASLSYQGTSTWVRDSVQLNQLNCTVSGTLWSLQFDDDDTTAYNFPMSEGGGLRVAHCINTGTLADVYPNWGKQDVYHHNMIYGATKLTNTQTGEIAFIPYNTSKVKVFNYPLDGTDYDAWTWTFTP